MSAHALTIEPATVAKPNLIGLCGEELSEFVESIDDLELEPVDGGRVLAVSALDPTLQGAADRASGAAETIAFDGVHYRRDIAAKALAQPNCVS